MARELTSEDYENLLAFRTSLRRFLHWSQTQARGVGMTPAHHQLLLAVKGHRGRRGPAIGDLAGYLLLRHHSTVELVGRAEAAGLVERWSDNDDGRIARVRLTAEGGLRTCLFSLHETPLRDLMRSGASDDHLGRVIETAIWRKEEGHLINQPGFIKPAKSMSQIGG